MNPRRLAPTVGIVACVLLVALLGLPYLVVDTPSAVGTYYGTGVVNPFIAGLLALLTVIVLAAGREGRTDPAMAAGIALSAGVFVLALAALWAFTVPEDVVFGMSTDTTIEYHRFVIVAVATVIPVSSLWYARGLGVV